MARFFLENTVNKIRNLALTTAVCATIILSLISGTQSAHAGLQRIYFETRTGDANENDIKHYYNGYIDYIKSTGSQFAALRYFSLCSELSCINIDSNDLHRSNISVRNLGNNATFSVRIDFKLFDENSILNLPEYGLTYLRIFTFTIFGPTSIFDDWVNDVVPRIPTVYPANMGGEIFGCTIDFDRCAAGSLGTSDVRISPRLLYLDTTPNRPIPSPGTLSITIVGILFVMSSRVILRSIQLADLKGTYQGKWLREHLTPQSVESQPSYHPKG